MKRFFGFIFCFIAGGFLTGRVYALDLREYIAGPNFIPHSLSTGEYIHFSNEGGSGGIRQYKNTNYEQFIYRNDGIYRREDTSWAPVPGYGDAVCSNGNKAIYTLEPGCNAYSEGQTLQNMGGAYWAPNLADVGDIWSTESHQIVTIDSGVRPLNYNYNLPPLRYCSPTNLGNTYQHPNACGQTQEIEFVAQYAPNTFTFCTGAKNPEDLIVLRVISGPGGPVGGDPLSGDTFYFMRGWGLVAFETGPSDMRFEAGLSDGPGIEWVDGYEPTCEIHSGGIQPKIPRTIIGRITKSTVTTINRGGNNIEVPNHPIQNARICIYQGELDEKTNGIGETIKHLEASTTTDENGFFSVNTFLRNGSIRSYKGGNFIAVFCGNDAYADLIPLTALQRTAFPTTYWRNLTTRPALTEAIPLKPTAPSSPSYPYDYLFEANNLIVPPYEIAIDCDVNPAHPSLSEEGESPWERPGVHLETGDPMPECPEELGYVDRSGNSSGAGQYNGTRWNQGKEAVARIHNTITLPPETKYTNNRTKIEDVPDEEVPSNAPEGRYKTGGLTTSVENALSTINCLIWGGCLEKAYWPQRSEKHDIFYDCEQIREANKTVGDNYNSQKSGGFLNLLPPFLSENYDISHEAMYQRADKVNTPICRSSVHGDIYLGDIQPPSRRYLHEDERDTYCNPETDENCRYLLPYTYYPYFKVAKVGAAPVTNPMYDIYDTAEHPRTAADRRQNFFDPDNPGENEEGTGYMTQTKALSSEGPRGENDFSPELTYASVGMFPNTNGSLASLIASPLGLVGNLRFAPAQIASYTTYDRKLASELHGHNDKWQGRNEQDTNVDGLYDIPMEGEGDDLYKGGEHKQTPLSLWNILASFFNRNNPECGREYEVAGCTPTGNDGDTCVCRLEPEGCDWQFDPDCQQVCYTTEIEYTCTGTVDPIDLNTAASVHHFDLGPVADSIDKTAALLLPPRTSESVPTRENTCIVDQYMFEPGDGAKEGADVPCSAAPVLIDKLRQAVSPPKIRSR